MLTPGQLAANARASFATQSFFNEMRWGYLRKNTFDELVDSAIEKMKQDVDAFLFFGIDKEQIKLEREAEIRLMANAIRGIVSIR